MQKDITLILVFDGASLDRDQKSYYKKLFDEFTTIIAVVKEGTDSHWIQENCTDSVSYSTNQGKVEGLNRAIQKVSSSFVLHLEFDERINVVEIPQTPQRKSCYPALIEVSDGTKVQQNYQIRLFPTPDYDCDLLKGFAIPDFNQSFQALQWKLSDQVIPIQKSNPLFKTSDAKAEHDSDKSNAISFLWKALLENDHQRYQQAEGDFRRALKHKPLFEFDYLAALNGLSNTLVEQHKLKEARTVAETSLTVSPHQRAPFLTLYKISELSGQPKKAYQYLEQYLEVFSDTSHANMDVRLSRSECHYLMADSTFKQGDYERAFQHYESFYELNNGEVSRQILEKLFIYAIELQNFEKSVRYFGDMFDAYIPNNLDDDKSARLLESLSLFMDNGWYNFVGNVYEKLVEYNPKDNRLLNRWITTLIKGKQIEKAQELLSRKAS